MPEMPLLCNGLYYRVNGLVFCYFISSLNLFLILSFLSYWIISLIVYLSCFVNLYLYQTLSLSLRQLIYRVTDQSTNPNIYQSIRFIFLRLSIQPSINLSIHMSVSQPFHPPVYPSTQININISMYVVTFSCLIASDFPTCSYPLIHHRVRTLAWSRCALPSPSPL